MRWLDRYRDSAERITSATNSFECWSLRVHRGVCRISDTVMFRNQQFEVYHVDRFNKGDDKVYIRRRLPLTVEEKLDAAAS